MTRRQKTDKKTELSIHAIIGASEYAQVRAKGNFRIGNRGDSNCRILRIWVDSYNWYTRNKANPYVVNKKKGN